MRVRSIVCSLALLSSCGGSGTARTDSTAATGPASAGGAGGGSSGQAGGGADGNAGAAHGGSTGGSAGGDAGAGAAAGRAGAGGAPAGSSGAHAGAGSPGAGAGGVSGGGTSGTAGSGGAPVVCAKLGAPDIVALGGDAQWEQRRARLAPLASDRVAVVLGLDAAESPGPVPSPLAHVEFAPWGAWPASLPAPTIVSANGGSGDFRVSQGTASGFGLLYHDDPFQPPMPPLGLIVVADVPEGATMASGPLLEGNEPSPPLWITRGATGEDLDQGLLAGWSYELPLDSIHYAVRFLWTGGPLVVDGLACGTSELSGDAVRSGKGFLVAATTSAPFGMCGKDGVPGPDGVPNRLQITRVDQGVASFGDELSEVGPILAVAMTARSDGAWVVWLPSGDPAAASPRASRVDESGKLVGTPFVVGAPGESGVFAVASLGDRLAVVQRQTIDPSAPTIGVFVYDDAGPVTTATVEAPGGQFSAPELSALGSPAGDALLVAWSTASGPYRAHVARLDCLP